MCLFNRKAKILSLLVTVFVLLSSVAALSQSEQVTIVGEVNDTHQIVANGEMYEVADNEIGDRLVYEYISQKVKVVGTIATIDDVKVITVIAFETIEE